MPTRRVAVIGAGMAGLACALGLTEGGVETDIFDKGRTVGGRCATRCRDGASFDHGAQFATARGVDFMAVLQNLAADGVAARWQAASTQDTARWVGVPGMSAIPRALAGHLPRPPLLGRQAAWLVREGGGWMVHHHGAEAISPGTVTPDGGDIAGPYDAVALALPSPQAAPLLAITAPDLAAKALEARYAPCWALMTAFSEPLDLPDIVRPGSHAGSDAGSKRGPGTIAWMAREASRPGRADRPERWVLQAGADWSRETLDWTPEAAAAAMLAAAPFAQTPSFVAAHRWRFALVEQALGTPYLWAPDVAVGACGDWCIGGRIEAAWDSGRALARAILGMWTTT